MTPHLQTVCPTIGLARAHTLTQHSVLVNNGKNPEAHGASTNSPIYCHAKVVTWTGRLKPVCSCPVLEDDTDAIYEISRHRLCRSVPGAAACGSTFTPPHLPQVTANASAAAVKLLRVS